jgi:FtsZ-interacting cell division protein ZipA
MSNLQLGLAIAGAVVLAVVVGHGAWTSRQNRPRQATLSSEIIEDEAQTKAPDTDEERQDPSFDSSLEALSTLTSIEKKATLDALIDVIVPITVDSQVSGEAALAAMQQAFCCRGLEH